MRGWSQNQGGGQVRGERRGEGTKQRLEMGGAEKVWNEKERWRKDKQKKGPEKVRR